MTSKLIESLRGDLAALHDAGAIGKVTMREFDAICPPPVREFSAADIKRLREELQFSQPVFARCASGSKATPILQGQPSNCSMSSRKRGCRQFFDKDK